MVGDISIFKNCRYEGNSGFTLIELSMVLVIMGLVIGGILVGTEMVESAKIRAQVSQIDRYQTAVNTFKLKYNALPGDMSASTASAYGFAARGQYGGEGDGDGFIEGVNSDNPYNNHGYGQGQGETVMFWSDLTYANGMNLGLIEGSFPYASPTARTYGTWVTNTTSPGLADFFPQGKLGGQFVLVYSPINATSAFTLPALNGSANYFGLQPLNQVGNGTSVYAAPNPGYVNNNGITVLEAYSIDKKSDDGLPQSGNIIAVYDARNAIRPCGADYGVAASASSSTCYDNGNVASAPMQYSMAQSNGNGHNCALSFQIK